MNIVDDELDTEDKVSISMGFDIDLAQRPSWPDCMVGQDKDEHASHPGWTVLKDGIRLLRVKEGPWYMGPYFWEDNKHPVNRKLRTLVQQPGITSTAATDGTRIYFDLDFCVELGADKLVSVLMEEADHVRFEHSLRKGTRNHNLANIAADVALNCMYVQSGRPSSGGAHISEMDGRSFEEVYDFLVKEGQEGRGDKYDSNWKPSAPPNRCDDPSQGDEGGNGEGEGEDGENEGSSESRAERAQPGNSDGEVGEDHGSSDEDLSGKGSNDSGDFQPSEQGSGPACDLAGITGITGEAGHPEQNKSGEGTEFPEPQGHEQGQHSGRNGQEGSWEVGGEWGTQSSGEILDFRGSDPDKVPSQQDRGEASAQVKENNIRNHSNAGQGSDCEELAKLLREEYRPAPQDWKDILADRLDNKSKVDIDWSRLKKKGLPFGICLPTRSGNSLGNVVLHIDTSGSIWYLPGAIEEMRLATQQILDVYQDTTLHVIYVDDRVQRYQEFESGDTVMFDPKGRGGTSFLPIFDWIESELEGECNIMISLTDLEAFDLGMLPKDPEFTCLWCDFAPSGEYYGGAEAKRRRYHHQFPGEIIEMWIGTK